MTREEAKVMAPIMKAFIEGKTIECRTKIWELNKGWRYSTNWKKTEQLIFRDNFEYRIKPEPKYRPFKNQEECWEEMLKHQPFGWIRSIHNQRLRNIDSIGHTICGIDINNSVMYFDAAFNEYNFADGTPFGIKEE